GVLWKFFLQINQCVNRIIRLWQAKLNVAGSQLVIIFRGAKDHFQALVIVQHRTFYLKWTLRCDHKPNLFQITVFRKMVGNGQMSYVNGVESAKIKSDFHWSFFKK